MDVLTQYGSGLGGSILFDFLLCRFGEVECPTTYRGDFVDLEEHWTYFKCQAFMVALFGSVLFPSQLGSISFEILPLVSTLPHSTSFIPSLLSKTTQSLSLCREIGSGRLDCCVHLLQMWFCSHLNVISRAQLARFLRKNRVKITVALDLPFTRDTTGWLWYLFGLRPVYWTWRVKWGITRWQG